jgi:hypothetical protein
MVPDIIVSHDALVRPLNMLKWSQANSRKAPMFQALSLRNSARNGNPGAAPRVELKAKALRTESYGD